MSGSDGTSGAYRGPDMSPGAGNEMTRDETEDFLAAFSMNLKGNGGKPIDLIYQVMGGDTIAKAVEEKRCIKEAIGGCGQDLLDENGHPRFVYEDKDTADLYYREWLITGLCGTCQDEVQAIAEKMANESGCDGDGCCGDAPCTCEEPPAF